MVATVQAKAGTRFAGGLVDGVVRLRGKEDRGYEATIRTANADRYIALLEKRRYLCQRMARDEWLVSYGHTWDEAWDRTYEKASEYLQSSQDYEIRCAGEAVEGAGFAPRLDNVKKRAREVVEKRLGGIGGLPPDTRNRAIGDAVTLAGLLELRGTGLKDWSSHFDLMARADEVWERGFARFAMVKGKQLVYGLLMDAPGNLMRQ